MIDSANTKCSPRRSRFLTAELWFAAAADWYGIICILSQIPGKEISRLPFSFWDKGAHFAVYGVLGFLVCGAFRLRRRRPLVALALTAALAAMLGGLDEIHQIFVPGRCPGLDDATADLLGGVFGGGIALAVLYRLRGVPAQDS